MSYRKQKKLSLLPTRSDGLASFLLISFNRCCPLSFGEAHFCRRRRSQKAITSDQRGFAGVRPTATHAPPANMRSPVLRSPAQSVFRRAGRSSELTVSFGGPTFETANTKRPGFLLAPHLCIYALTRYPRCI